MNESQLSRLFRAAAKVQDQRETEPPYGFEMRVVALWRSSLQNGNGLSRLVRRVAIMATAVIIVSSAAVVRELNRTRDLGEPMTNEFAIADSAIQDELGR